MSEPLIQIDMAVNDDNGNTIDHVDSIHFPGMELESINDAGVHFREVYGRTSQAFHGFYVSRRKWPCSHLRSCVGNIFWERYGMDAWSAVAFVHFLRESKLFTFDGGFIELSNYWDSLVRDDAHLRRLLLDAAKDDRL